jgi:hypothetical protein
VIYTQPPQATVRIKPTASRNFPNANEDVGEDLVISKNHKNTNAKRGPEVKAMKIWKIALAGYLSPVVALTLGNHSYEEKSTL